MKSIKTILKKYVNNTTNKVEFRKLLDHLISPGGREEVKENIRQSRKQISSGSSKGNYSDDFKNVQSNLMKKIAKDRPHSPAFTTDTRYRTQSSSWVKVAAVVTLVLIASAAIYTVMRPSQGSAPMLVKNVANGQKSTVTLADGSIIRLNAGSRLTYPETFESDTRSIQLVGEAFFEVVRDEKRPFIIKSGDLVTTVLGTSFNISAFPDQDISVTVATGKVRVESSSKSDSPFEGAREGNKGQQGDVSKDQGPKTKSQLLTPGQQATFKPTTGELTKTEVDIDQYIAWKDGILVLQDKSFEELEEILEKWYGVPVTIEGEKLKTCMIRAKFQNPSMKKLMDALKYIYEIEYDFIEGGVHISGSGEGCE